MERGGDGERGRWREGETERGRDREKNMIVLFSPSLLLSVSPSSAPPAYA
jgi:hypothetical protein